jgi:ParB/Sulfiredoxin domain
MIGAAVLMALPVAEVELDCNNPRIRKWIEMYGDNPNFDQMCLALGAAGDDETESSTSFEKLKSSILTNRGVIQPIIVNRKKNGKLVCIEGNTRLALYKCFLRDGVEGNWTQIPSLVYEDMGEVETDAIRLQIHLVGTRPWDPYSKAKYLHYLRMHERLPFSAMVDFCGGRQKEVIESINAFQDMETYYRPVVPDDTSFDTSRFSGFVELQKPGVKEAILESGFTLSDFAKWIHEEKLYPLNTVRFLPRILKNPKAREVFVKHGARKAVEVLDRPDLNKALLEATVGQLARALTQAIYNLPWHEAEKLRADSGGETTQYLNEALITINALLNPKGTEA